MIELKGVSKTYKTGVPALRNINLTIRDGEFCFIVGKSGSGKTTLVRLLTKETDTDDGSIIVNDTDLRKLKRRLVPAYRRRLGVVFQDFRLLEDRTVYENIAFAQLIAGASDSEIFDNVTKMLGLTGLSSKADSYPRQLSGGEQQRTAIARALINRPEILIADEPTGNLDHENAEEIMKLLEKVNSRGTTVIVITHDREMVNRMHKRTVSMSLGEIVSDGFPETSNAQMTSQQKAAEDSSLLSFEWLKTPPANRKDSPVSPETDTDRDEAEDSPESGNIDSETHNYEDDWVEDWDEKEEPKADEEEYWLDEEYEDTSQEEPYPKETGSSENNTRNSRGLKGAHRPHHKAGKEDAK